jgi:hypothetical protein
VGRPNSQSDNVSPGLHKGWIEDIFVLLNLDKVRLNVAVSGVMGFGLQVMTGASFVDWCRSLYFHAEFHMERGDYLIYSYG